MTAASSLRRLRSLPLLVHSAELYGHRWDPVNTVVSALVTRREGRAVHGSIIEHRETATVAGHPAASNYILTGN